MHTFQYNRNERLKIQDPIKILNDIGLKKGNVFIDIGSNDGFFTIPASDIVGSEGRVYAVDINANIIEILRERLKDMKIYNVEAFVSMGEDFMKEEGIADIVFLGTVLHDFKNPLKVLKNSFLMLKKKGKLVDFDWKKKETEKGPPLEVRLSEKDSEGLLLKANFSNIRIEDISENFYQVTGFKS